MFFNSYVMTKHQKRDLVDSFYQKIVNVSRNKVFYTKLNIPDTLDGRYDLLALFSISTIILLVFSSDFDVILLIPVIPSMLSSILRVTICSISRGEAPGKTASTIIILADLSGKKVFLRLKRPIDPKIMISNMITFADTGYLTKYLIKFLILFIKSHFHTTKSTLDWFT